MDFISSVNDVLWGPWTPYALLLAGVLFTVWSRFTQYTAMTHGIQVVRGVYDDPDDPGAINHFQALSAALSATVGLGNIGGVALAIGPAVPGALFWMWVTGVFGMALKTIEITLAMMYRNVDDPDNPHGGAMWVVEKVVGSKGGVWKPIARTIGVFFCITLIVSTFTGGNMFQSWNVANLTFGYFGVPKVATGIVLALLVGAVIVGGIKRIGNVAGRLVPFMVGVYLLSAFAVLASNVADIPAMFALVFKSAFSPTEGTGAFIGGTLGWAFSQGMRRALFSNEAGQGSAPIAHAAAKTGQPAREGIVGGIGPFIDTLCICTLTALVILLTGTWNREAIQDQNGVKAPISAPVQFEQTGTGNHTWEVVSNATPASLPSSKWAEWNTGSTFFLVAEITGATNNQTGGNRLQVRGTIEETQVGPEAAPVQSIVWDPVEVGPDDWTGTPTDIALVDGGVYHNFNGAVLTGHAFDRQFFGLGKYLVTFAAWLFALSTMISWSYYGEQGMVYMTGNKGVLPYKLVFLVLVIYAAVGIDSTHDMEVFMDLGTGAMLWSNLPIVILLGHLAVRCLADYKRDLAAGKFKRHKVPSIVDVVGGKDVE